MQMYAWGYSTYRRTGQALGTAPITAYRSRVPMASLCAGLSVDWPLEMT